MSIVLQLQTIAGASLVVDALLCLAAHEPDRAGDAVAYANAIGEQLDRLPRRAEDGPRA